MLAPAVLFNGVWWLWKRVKQGRRNKQLVDALGGWGAIHVKYVFRPVVRNTGFLGVCQWLFICCTIPIVPNCGISRMDQQGKGNKMKPSLRIPLSLTVIVVMGIITFIKIMTKTGAFPTAYFIIWIVMSVILIGINIWYWLRNKQK
jgi:hypothetical protein